MKYKILTDSDRSGGSFEERVQDHLSRGWRLQGGVSVYYDEITFQHQALVLPDEVSDPGWRAGFDDVWQLDDPHQVASLLRKEVDRREYLKSITHDQRVALGRQVEKELIKRFDEIRLVVPEAELKIEEQSFSLLWRGKRVSELACGGWSFSLRRFRPGNLVEKRDFDLHLREAPSDWVWIEKDVIPTGRQIPLGELARYLTVLLLRAVAREVE